MINLHLFGNQTYQWKCRDNHYFTGYFSDDNNVFYAGFEAIDFFLQIEKTQTEYPKLNGIYTLIKLTDKGITIVSDVINYFPVFYLKQNDNWMISDDWNFLLKLKNGISPNIDAKEEFLSIGFVLDNETLDKDILKTRGGETLFLNNDGTFYRVFNYYFLPDSFLNDSFQNLNKILITKLYEAGKRLIKFLNSRTAVIPLSGGFDSRLITCILKNLNYENVICFTYGRKSRESEISEKVAKQLGYQWFFIDYNEIELETFLDDEDFLSYMKSVGNGFAMPYLQEYFAVKKIRKDNLVPENSVFLSGHVGDNIAGSYVLKSMKTKKQNDKLPKILINNYFFFKKNNKKETKQLQNRISKTIYNYPPKNRYSKKYNPYIEDWCVKEKFSKFLFHSSKVFDFWGYETYFLLWDDTIVHFFRQLPYEFRENKWLYDEVAINEFFIKQNVYFNEEEMKVTSLDITIQKMKNKIRDFFPWKYLLKKMKKNDWMHYSEFTSMMEDKMEEKGYQRVKRFRSYNFLICKWYLDFIGF